RVIHAAGHRVVVRERSRRAGGRMASRLLDGRPVDLGAAYFTARETAFRDVVDGWMGTGRAPPWTNRFETYGADGWSRTQPGPLRYRARGGLGSVVEDLVAGLKLRLGEPVTAVGE